MDNITIVTASALDKKDLLRFFSHYLDKELSEKRVDCYLLHKFTVVAKDKDKIIGMVQWYAKEDPASGVAEIEEFFVLEEYRGMGIGTKIIAKTVDFIGNYFKKLEIRPRKIFLFVSQKNTQAINLYKKVGFVKLAEVSDLFADFEQEDMYCFSFK